MLPEKEAVMTISKELLDELLKDCERPEDLLGETGLMKEPKVNHGAFNRIREREAHHFYRIAACSASRRFCRIDGRPGPRFPVFL